MAPPSSFAPPFGSTPRRSCSTTGTAASSSTCYGSWQRAGPSALHLQKHPIERQPARAGEEQRDRRRQKNEVELPAAVSSESPVHLHRLEADRPDHDDGEPGGRRSGEKADQHTQSPQRLDDGQEPEQGQHAGRQLRRGLHLPHSPLLGAVDQEDDSDAEAEGQQGPVAQALQIREESHESSPPPFVALSASVTAARS